MSLRLNLLSFLLLGSYGVSLPAAQALFLQRYGSEGLPWVWLAVTLVQLCTVWAVGSLTRRLPLIRCFVLICWLSAVTLAALLLAEQAAWSRCSHAAFLLYIWKDIYIVILVELFWTATNLAFVSQVAARSYGWFCASGTLGGIVASVAVARLATLVGTRTILWSSAPILVLCAWAALAPMCRRQPAARR